MRPPSPRPAWPARGPRIVGRQRLGRRFSVASEKSGAAGTGGVAWPARSRIRRATPGARSDSGRIGLTAHGRRRLLAVGSGGSKRAARQRCNACTSGAGCACALQPGLDVPKSGGLHVQAIDRFSLRFCSRRRRGLSDGQDLGRPGSAAGSRSSRSICRPTAGVSSICMPGAGRETVAVCTGDSAASEAAASIARSDGNPERLRWCSFVTNDRLVCRFSVPGRWTATASSSPSTRLICRRTPTAASRSCSASASPSSTHDLRQFDGTIIDWLAGSGRRGPDEPRLCSRGGPDRARAWSGGRGPRRRPDRRCERLRSASVEPANPTCQPAISRDGRGNVRIMATATVRGATGQLEQPHRLFLSHRRASRDWQPLRQFRYAQPGRPDPGRGRCRRSNAAYVLRKLNGRARALPDQARRLDGDRAGLCQPAGRRRRRRPRRAAARA